MRIRALMTAAAFLFPATSMAATVYQVIPCDNTTFESGAYGLYWAPLYGHSAANLCGGDPFDTGDLRINSAGEMIVRLRGVHEFNMYEVYWVPLGEDPVSFRTYVGNLLTDCNGDVQAKLREITTPAERLTGTIVDIRTEVGTYDSGQFYFYSRGPWGDTDDGSCYPTNVNSSDGTDSGTLNNPVLWGGMSFFDGVQFITGYARP